MARKQVAFTWQVLMDDAEQDAPFRRASPAFAEDQAPQSRPGRRWWWAMVGLAIAMATIAGYRLYGAAQAGVATLESELQDAIVLESYTAASPAVGAEQTPPALQSFELRNGVAAVEIVIHDPSRPLPYRETRFYRETEYGWQPTTKAASFWGSRQQLESEHFIFHFPRRDYAAVLAAAPALDAVYAGLYRDLGRAMPDAGERITVEVFAGDGLNAQGLRAAAPDSIWLPSPGLLQIPLDVSDADAIVLSADIALVYRLLPRTSADWLANGRQPVGWWWQPLAEGLRLWLLWENNPLFASWRQDTLTWYLTNSFRPCLRKTQTMPADSQEFCQMLTVLDAQPLDSLSFPCTGTFGAADGNTYYLSAPGPPMHLSRLGPLTPTDGTPARMVADLLQRSYNGQVVAMATLLDYVAVVYGRDRIPAFLAAFATHERWETLVPAVFGVSADEFDAGWHAYLVEHYRMTQH